MKALRDWLSRFHRRLDNDIAEEISYHYDNLEAEGRARGLDAAAARAAAKARFGDPALIRAKTRDVFTVSWFDSVSDIALAARLLAKDARFTAIAALALALGIGATTIVFTIVNAFVIRGLPFHDAEQIVWIGTRDISGTERGISYQEYQEVVAATSAFSATALFYGNQLSVSDDATAAEQYRGLYATAGFFELLGVQPVLGRYFNEQDDQPASTPTILIAHRIWMNRYASDPAIVGRTIRVNGLPLTVIGVMPEGFQFPIADLWIPFAHLAPEFRRESIANRSARPFEVIGRLRRDASVNTANIELGTIGRRLEALFPATNRNITPVAVNFSERYTGRQLRQLVLTMMGAVTFVLLIACANVANLLLARSANRSAEISVRLALGATRWRVLRQLLIESTVLALVGGAVGLGLAVGGLQLFDAVTQDVAKPYWITLSMDPRVFAFFASVCLATGIVFGLAPALHASKTALNESLKERGRGNGQGRRARRWTNLLMAAEFAMTLSLLAGAGLMIRSFIEVYSMNLGFDTRPLVTMRLNLAARRYPTPEKRRLFFEALERRLTSVPELHSSTVVTSVPAGGGQTRQVEVDGGEVAAGAALVQSVSVVYVQPNYWQTLGTRLHAGRAFDANDGGPGHPNAIINARFAEVHFGNDDPLGRQIRLTMEQGPGVPRPTRQPLSVTVVGLAPNIRQRSVETELPDPVVYLPLLPEAPASVFIMARGTTGLDGLTAVLREQVRALDSELPLYSIQMMDQLLSRQRWGLRVFGAIFVTFALIALVLAAIGIYGVTSHSVAQRTQEVGIRMALGADAAQVRWLFMRQSLWPLMTGLAAGLVGAATIGTLLQTFLIRTEARDPITLISIVIVLTIVAVLATYWASRRATRGNPIGAMRHG